MNLDPRTTNRPAFDNRIGALAWAGAAFLIIVAACLLFFRWQHTIPAPKPAKPVTLEFYWLKDIQSDRNPGGRWQMSSEEGIVTFKEVASHKTISSDKHPRQVLTEVVGVPTNKPILTGKDLLPNAKADVDSGNLEGAIIRIDLNSEGSKKFADFTGDHVGDYLAIFCDGKLLTAPVIHEKILGGRAQVSGFRTLKEANEIAISLNAPHEASKKTVK